LVFGDTFVLRDHLTLNLPSRAHLAASLRGGDIPEWWGGVGLGVPFAANPLNGVTYAPTWLVSAPIDPAAPPAGDRRQPVSGCGREYGDAIRIRLRARL
jgi:hypothetical protein